MCLLLIVIGSLSLEECMLRHWSYKGIFFIFAILQFNIVVNSVFIFMADFTQRDQFSSNLRTNVSDTRVILQFNSVIGRLNFAAEFTVC